MKNENITKWAHDLATTDVKQGTGALVLINPEGTKAYCCLGFGACITMTGVKVTLPDAEARYQAVDGHSVDDQPAAVVDVGEGEITDLAPREFVEWLGYSPAALAGSSWDIFPDWPTNLRVRSGIDQIERESGGNRNADGTGLPLVHKTLASLNDDGFTFAQIADVINHFGLCDEIQGSPYTGSNPH